MSHQIVFFVSRCVYNSSTAASYEIPVLRQVSDLLSLQIVIVSVTTKKVYAVTLYPWLENSPVT